MDTTSRYEDVPKEHARLTPPHLHAQLRETVSDNLLAPLNGHGRGEPQPAIYDITKLLSAECKVIKGKVYNHKGHVICGVLNQHDKPCHRIGRCPFHNYSTPVSKDNCCHGYVDEHGSAIQDSNGYAVNEPQHPPKKQQYKHGWSKKEHYLFLRALKKHQRGAWKQIAAEVMSRNPTQVQSHAQKFYQRQQQTSKNKRSIHDFTLDSPEMEEMEKELAMEKHSIGAHHVGVGVGVGLGVGPAAPGVGITHITAQTATVHAPLDLVGFGMEYPPPNSVVTPVVSNVDVARLGTPINTQLAPPQHPQNYPPVYHRTHPNKHSPVMLPLNIPYQPHQHTQAPPPVSLGAPSPPTVRTDWPQVGYATNTVGGVSGVTSDKQLFEPTSRAPAPAPVSVSDGFPIYGTYQISGGSGVSAGVGTGAGVGVGVGVSTTAQSYEENTPTPSHSVMLGHDSHVTDMSMFNSMKAVGGINKAVHNFKTLRGGNRRPPPPPSVSVPVTVSVPCSVPSQQQSLLPDCGSFDTLTVSPSNNHPILSLTPEFGGDDPAGVPIGTSSVGLGIRNVPALLSGPTSK